MSFSYEPELDNNIYRVRFLLQDTSEADHELEDEEISYLLITYGSVGNAALAAARSLFAKYSRQVSKAVGDLRISLSDKATNWKKFMDQLETNALVFSPSAPYFGGQSLNEVDEDHEDVDLPPAQFEIGMNDFDPSTDWSIFRAAP